MLRTFALFALGLFSLCLWALPDATPAHANGILVATSGGGEVEVVDPRGRRRPPHQALPPVRLEGHRVAARLRGQIAEVTVEQVFRNHSGLQLEGTYLFPLPEGAVVSDFAMTMFGKMVQGEIIEREEARRIYESIVRARRDPGLLEYMGRGLFRARVFPIEPHKDLTIRLTFQQVLTDNDGTLEFRYPLATDRLNAAAVSSVAVTMDIESDVDLKGIYSPSHDIAITRDGNRRAKVSYERAGERQDKDLILYVNRSPDAVGFSLLSSKEPGEDGTFMAVFAPRNEVAEKDRIPKDVVYVIDTSGSMAGKKMEQARRALAYGVSLLKSNDRFNLVGFSMNVNPFRDGLVEASGEMKDAATRWIDALEPRGGTNISEALAAALSMRQAERLFMVVFLTDGKPTMGDTDPTAIENGVKAKNASNSRIFTFGVGFDLDVGLLDRIAEITNGARDYVTPDEDIEVATGRFFRKVDQPVLSDVKLEFGPGVTDVYPQRLPDLFAGSQVVVFGRYKDSGERTLLLRGRMGARELVHEYNATFVKGPGPTQLPRLWASRKVATLLDAIRLHGEDKELVEEVIRLATRYAIVTPYTAGLVVEESEIRSADRLRLADAPRRGTAWDMGGLRPPSTPSPTPGTLHGGRTAGPASSGSGAPAADSRHETEASKELRRLKSSEQAAAAEPDGEDAESKAGGKLLAKAKGLVREVEGKTFLKRADETWVDTAWDGKGETTKVQAFSEAYFKLLSTGDRIARWLAVAEKVILKVGERVYEITPAP